MKSWRRNPQARSGRLVVQNETIGPCANLVFPGGRPSTLVWGGRRPDTSPYAKFRFSAPSELTFSDLRSANRNKVWTNDACAPKVWELFGFHIPTNISSFPANAKTCAANSEKIVSEPLPSAYWCPRSSFQRPRVSFLIDFYWIQAWFFQSISRAPYPSSTKRLAENLQRPCKQIAKDSMGWRCMRRWSTAGGRRPPLSERLADICL